VNAPWCRGIALAPALLLSGEVMAQAQDDHDHITHAEPAGDAPARDPERPQAARNLPLTPVPPLTDADRAAAVAPEDGHPAHDNALHGHLLLDRLEAWDAQDATGQAWDVDGWLGTDINRLWLRSEGERLGGRTASADVQLLFGRSLSAWWDVVAGVRHDLRPQDARTFVALGMQGTAPQWLELEITGYVGEGGRTAARFDAHYELDFTGRLILQWQLQADLYGKSDTARALGSGLATAETGLRLRYEITRRFAPYVGLAHERAFGRTASLQRDEGEDVGDTRIVVGLRTWF